MDSLNLLHQPCLTQRGLRLTPTSPRIRKRKRWRHRGKRGGMGRHNITIVYQNPRYLGSAPHTLPLQYLNTRIDIKLHPGRIPLNLKPLMRAKPHANLNVHTWNANSLRNKSDILVDYILENDVDIMFLTETCRSRGMYSPGL